MESRIGLILQDIRESFKRLEEYQLNLKKPLPPGKRQSYSKSLSNTIQRIKDRFSKLEKMTSTTSVTVIFQIEGDENPDQKYMVNYCNLSKKDAEDLIMLTFQSQNQTIKILECKLVKTTNRIYKL